MFISMVAMVYTGVGVPCSDKAEEKAGLEKIAAGRLFKYLS